MPHNAGWVRHTNDIHLHQWLRKEGQPWILGSLAETLSPKPQALALLTRKKTEEYLQVCSNRNTHLKYAPLVILLYIKLQSSLQ